MWNIPCIANMLFCASILAQSPQNTEPAKKVDSPASQPAQSAQKDATKADGKVAPPGAPAAAPAPELSEADKFVEAAIEKLQKVKAVSAKLNQTVQVDGTEVNSKGVYKRLNDGPNSKCWIEIETKKGDSTGKHLQVCDGTYLHIFKQLLNDEMLESIKVKEIYALFDEREIPAVELKNLRTMFEGNFVPNPEAMLRGYRGSIDFKTITKNQTVGGRSTTMVEGHWNKAALTRMTKGATANPTIESLPAGQAQYIRVFLDDETGWPLRAELFFRNKELEMTPVYIIEFKEIKFPPTLADSEFKYEVPTKEKNPKVNIQDMTVRIKSMLQQNLGKYKPKAGATTTDNVSGPITLGGNKMDEKKQDAPAGKKEEKPAEKKQ